MLFTIQAFLEDFLSRRRLIDSDGYAVRLANLYYYKRPTLNDDLFYKKAHTIGTTLFVNNGISDRASFERKLIGRLDHRFKKKLENDISSFPGGTAPEEKVLHSTTRLTIGTLLQEFKHAVEARAIDVFWKSRKQGRLRSKPEKIAQTHFALFTKGVLLRRKGLILREMSSGIGFVDIGVVFASTLHLIEIKILSGTFKGQEQLEQYMRSEQRRTGTLLIFDARPPGSKLDLPESICSQAGMIKVFKVDINPPAPSSLN